MSNALFVRIIFGYAKIARFRYRRSPEVLARIDEFVARRTDLDRRAAQHRLHLIAEYDPREHRQRGRNCRCSACRESLDPIVPWPLGAALAEEALPGLAGLQGPQERRPQRAGHRAGRGGAAGAGMDGNVVILIFLVILILVSRITIRKTCQNAWNGSGDLDLD